jgi:hypothetical protein
MTKPNIKTIILLSVVALALLAFTVSSEWSKPAAFNSRPSLSKNKEGIITNLNFSPGQKTNPAHGQPGHQCGIPVGAALTASNTANAAPETANLDLQNLGKQSPLLNLPKAGVASNNALASVSTTGLNPAHGQPGHRCDIAVGAPLTSTPAKTQSTPATTTVTSSSAPKKNPAHGQPYHRCDISVGAPLDSIPAAKAATTTPVVNSPAIKKDMTATPTYTYDSTGAALNPAHGMPGHDCAIAVGKPLKIK